MSTRAEITPIVRSCHRHFSTVPSALGQYYKGNVCTALYAIVRVDAARYRCVLRNAAEFHGKLQTVSL